MRTVLGVFAGIAVVFIFAAASFGDEDLSALVKKFNAACQAQDWKAACAVVKEIGALNNEKAVEVLLKTALIVENSQVFKASKEALLSITDKEAISYMCKQTLKHNDWEVRALLTEVIGKQDSDESLETLISVINDHRNRPEVHLEAVHALKAKGKKEAMDALIDLLDRVEGEKGTLWVEIRKALTALTGDDYANASDWRAYWAKRKEELKSEPKPSEPVQPANPTGKPGEPRTSLDEEIKKAPKFFGAEVLSRRIVFIIDCSSSMVAKDPVLAGPGEGQKPQPPQPPPGGGGGTDPFGGDPSLPEDRKRMTRVKNELKKCIAAMDPRTKFNIISFATSVNPWKPSLILATAQNKQEALAWVDTMTHEGWTHTDDAFKKAFEDKEFDTIYFLSDGQPMKMSGPVPAETILEFVRNANKVRKVKINTFGFANAKNSPNMNVQEMMKLLKGLAEENQGKFTDIYW
jgi:hypothetical protein